jgi:hypothetical protein
MKLLGIIASSLMKKITDTFTRTVSGALGTADTGQLWTTLRGTWYATGSQAKSDDAGSAYALATVPVGSANATVSASVSGGVGVSFWATDSGSWFAVVPYYNETSQNVYNSCCTTSTVCTGSYTYTYPTAANCSTATSYSAVGAAAVSRDCPAGASHVNCSGSYYETLCFTKSYSCPSGYSVNGSKCMNDKTGYDSTVYFPACTQTTDSAPTQYSCSGYTCSGSGPYKGGDIGYTVSQCYCGTTTTTCSCAGIGGSPSSPNGPTSSCQEQRGCSYPSCSACGGGTQQVCNGCTETVYSQFYYLRMYSSVSGTVTQPVSDVNVGQAIGSIKVITSGTGVTAQAYSGNLTGTIGSAMTHTTTATRGTSAGIIKTTSNYSQGSTADNFSAEV